MATTAPTVQSLSHPRQEVRDVSGATMVLEEALTPDYALVSGRRHRRRRRRRHRQGRQLCSTEPLGTTAGPLPPGRISMVEAESVVEVSRCRCTE